MIQRLVLSRRSDVIVWLCLLTVSIAPVALPQATQAQVAQPGIVDYAIVYVRAPRFGDEVNVPLPEVKDPIQMPYRSPEGTDHPTDLMLLHPDGTEEVLVSGGTGGIVDPMVSFDGEWIYYATFHDLSPENQNTQRRNASRAGSDIYRVQVAPPHTIVRLTYQEWTPNTGVADWSDDHLASSGPGTSYLKYGIFNLGPTPLPGGKVMFTSSRNGFSPNQSFTFPNLQLFVMDDDGKNVEQVGHLNLGSALHPTVLTDGRVMFSSYEAQGLRDRRVWGLWSMWPDGREWAPLMSAFTAPSAFHFQTELSNRNLAVVDYYNQNNNGFGTLLMFPPAPPDGVPGFGNPTASHETNPLVRRGIWWFDESHPSHKQPRFKQYSFSPYGLEALSGFSHGEDNASSKDLDGDWAGKVTHPSGAPGNDVLVVWSPGPANDLNRPTSIPTYDAGLYLIQNGTPIDDHRDLIQILNDPAYNELQPRAVVPYSAIYGIDEPASLEWLPNDGSHPLLPAGTPFGLVGTSSFYKRDTSPGKGSSLFLGLDPFNTSQNDASTNWVDQGADAGWYTNADIYAVRVLAMEPTSHISYGPINQGKGFFNHANERLRILGEIPLRKYDGDGTPILDVDGNPDTSFLAKIPADTPYTFQTLDKNGLVLNMAQTWHQARPGEVRTNCGGCHAHSQLPTDFATTEAAKSNFVVPNLALTTPLLTKNVDGETTVKILGVGAVDVEYYRDIKPILERSCVACHSGPEENAPARLVLDDSELVGNYEGTYHRLCNDSDADYGIPPVISNGTWRQTNASRYVRKFQSRRSLLVWKVFGQRLDGFTNDMFPTEAVPGDPTTLGGANANDADIDFTGTIMPPPNASVPPLSEDEKMMFARWVDLGCAVSDPDPDKSTFSWFGDDLRPTLTVSRPRAGNVSTPLDIIRFGAFDYYSGLDRGSLSVTATMALNGHPAGTELAAFFSETDDHIWTMPVSPPMTEGVAGELVVRVADRHGNITEVKRSFGIGDNAPPVVAAPGDLTVVAGVPVVFNLTVTDSNPGDVLSLLSPDLPSGATLAPGDNGLWAFQWNTGAENVGQTMVTFVANDGIIDSQPVEMTITVNPAPATLTLTLVARDQLNQNVSGAELVVRGHGTVASGATLDVEPGASLVLRGKLGNIVGPSIRQTVDPSMLAVVVPFWTAPLVVRDQSGNAVFDVAIYGRTLSGRSFRPGASLTLPKGATVFFRGQRDGVRGQWMRFTFDTSLPEVVVPFRTAPLVAQDR